jgi:hypothetical protein
MVHGFLVSMLTMGTLACATPAAGQTLRRAAEGYELEVLVDGAAVPTFSHDGASYLLGALGQRYTLRIYNRTERRVEAVASVDGRDVLDGRPGDVRKRGYLVPAYGFVDIDGWRLDDRSAAAFRFAPVADSYAARTGNAREVGVIGVAIFPERERPVVRRERRAPAAPSLEAESDRAASGAAPAPARKGLGTEFGEQVDSPVYQVAFTRASASRPALVLGARYDDHAGLRALGIDVDGTDDLSLRQTAQPFPVVQRSYATPPRGWRR